MAADLLETNMLLREVLNEMRSQSLATANMAESLREIKYEIANMKSEIANLNKQMDMILGLNQEGHYVDLRCVIHSVNNVEKKLDLLLDNDTDGYYNLKHVINEEKEIKKRLGNMVNLDENGYYSFKNILNHFNTVENKLDDVVRHLI